MHKPIVVFEVLEITKSEVLVSNGFTAFVVDCKATLDVEESAELSSSQVIDIESVSFEVHKMATLIVHSDNCTIASIGESVTLSIELTESLVKDITHSIELHVNDMSEKRIADIFGDE